MKENIGLVNRIRGVQGRGGHLSPRRHGPAASRSAGDRRRLWIGVLLAPALLAFGCARGQRAAAPPNVILISIDCLNERQFEEALSRGELRNLGRLADDALVFSRAYAHAPWTTPSHMSMLTGLYPSQHGRNVPYGLMIRFQAGDDRVPSYQTLPERLSRAGYEAVAFVGAGTISAVFGLGQGFSSYRESDRKNAEESDLPATLSGLEAWLDSRPPRPFFLFLHTYELHMPLARERRPLRRALDYLDDRLGDVFTMLRRRGHYDSSLIVLTGDHGSNMIRTEGKCCLHGAGHYEENLRVPFLLKLPARASRGRRDLLVRHVDILPTALDVVGLGPLPYDGPGSSLLKRLAGAVDPEVVSFSEADGRCRSRRAIVTDRYKYIFTPDRPEDRLLMESPRFFDGPCSATPACRDVAPEELYDLKTDPFEERNLLRGPLSSVASTVLGRLREVLTRHLNLPPAYRHRLTVREGGPDVMNDETREALRALGYVQ